MPDIIDLNEERNKVRNEIALRILQALVTRTSWVPRDAVGSAFDYADEFIQYATKERQK